MSTPKRYKVDLQDGIIESLRRPLGEVPIKNAPPINVAFIMIPFSKDASLSLKGEPDVQSVCQSISLFKLGDILKTKAGDFKINDLVFIRTLHVSSSLKFALMYQHSKPKDLTDSFQDWYYKNYSGIYEENRMCSIIKMEALSR